MPWLQSILAGFAILPANPHENEFYGLYNKILNVLFPPDSPFLIRPQYLRPPLTQVTNSLVTYEYEVFPDGSPVFILHLKAPEDIEYPSTCEDADRQMRARLRDLRRTCPIPILHGVSAMGTRLCFYHVPSGNQDAAIEPPYIQPHPVLVTDTALAERWDCDVLDADGEVRLRAVVDQIRQACAALNHQ